MTDDLKLRASDFVPFVGLRRYSERCTTMRVEARLRDIGGEGLSESGAPGLNESEVHGDYFGKYLGLGLYNGLLACGIFGGAVYGLVELFR